MSTNSDNRRIAKNTIFLYSRMLLVMVVTLYTSRLVLKALGVVDYGIYNVVGGTVSMFSILTGSLSSAISRFFTFELGKKDFARLQKIFSTSLSIQLIMILIVFILLEIVGVWFLNYKMSIPATRLGAANWVLQISIATFLFGLFKIPFNAAIIAHEKMVAFAYLGVVEVVLKLLIALVLLHSVTDHLILYANLQLALSVVLGLFYILYSAIKLEGCKLIFQLDVGMLKKMLSYSLWSFMGTVAYTCYNYGYNILLNVFFDTTVNAARGISVQVQHAVESFSNNFQMSINPQIIKNYSTGNIERMHALVFASSKYSYFLMLLLSLPIIIEADIILNLWLTIVPSHTVNFVRLVLSIITLNSLAGPMIASCMATGNIKKFETTIGILMALSIPICYSALCFGSKPESIYVIYFVFSILALFGRFLIVSPLINLNWKEYIRKVVVPIVSVTVVSLPLPIVLYELLNRDSYLNFLVICFCSLFAVATSAFYVGIGQLEREFVISKMRLLIKRFFK